MLAHLSYVAVHYYRELLLLKVINRNSVITFKNKPHFLYISKKNKKVINYYFLLYKKMSMMAF